MEPKSAPTKPDPKLKRLNFKLNEKSEQPYHFTVLYKEDDITIIIEETKTFPIKIFELKTSLKDLKELDDNFTVFRNCERFINGIKNCVESEKYTVKYNQE